MRPPRTHRSAIELGGDSTWQMARDPHRDRNLHAEIVISTWQMARDPHDLGALYARLPPCERGADADARGRRYTDYRTATYAAWAFVVLWPVGMPLLYFTLVYACRKDIKQGMPSHLAMATSFLWREYRPK